MKKITEQGMLTKTYTSLTLSSEQKTAWQVLSKLNARLQEAKSNTAEATSFASVKAALQEFIAADRYYRARAIEKHVIPAIRERIPQADVLLAELESLSASALQALQHVHEQMHARQTRFVSEERTALSAMEQYCRHWLERLGKEESELIPLAFRSLTPEEWFAIAVKCLPEEDACGKKAA